jgi:hypothetical protein
MFQKIASLFVFAAFLALVHFMGRSGLRSQAPAKDDDSPLGTLEERFSGTAQPFFKSYCFSCHGPKKRKGHLDLSREATLTAISKKPALWERVLERLEAREMPPEDTPKMPTATERAAVIAWLRQMQDRLAERTAGDPGPVLTRRLSNAEFDYTIHDLTGVDIRPAKEFPVDPANEAGFDNSGESLAMSPALLKKYLGAARLVSEHVVFKPRGFVFAPHPVVTDTDRDKYCVKRIIDFYKRHEVNLVDYFLAAFRYRYREKEGRSDAKLSDFAVEKKLNAKYLTMVWSALTEGKAEAGPLAAVRQVWNGLALPGPEPRLRKTDLLRLSNLTVQMRRELQPKIKKLGVSGISAGSQPLVLGNNRRLAIQHRLYSGDLASDLKKLAALHKGENSGLAKWFVLEETEAGQKKMQKSLEQFCWVFPDAFVVTDRGPYFDPKAAGKGRPLTAGFHLMQGYFRDDQPLCELILTDKEKRELDELWHELNFITLAPLRQYRDFIFFERAEPPRFMMEAGFDFARSEDKDCTSETKMNRLAKAYLAKAIKKGANEDAVAAIEGYFQAMSAEIRRVEKARLAAESGHLKALLHFAERAYRRPLAKDEKEDLLAFYRKLREKDDPGHEDALRDTIASVLLSPHFCYRITQAEPGAKAQPLSGYELASRLSYFLWSSMPDAELLAHAATGDLHKPEVLKSQTRRMLRDPKIRRLATEFVGNWLDFRRFEEHNAVDRHRFPGFTNELRQSMFEEPIRYFVDIAQSNRSVLDLVYGKDTFVNALLAKHYGIDFKRGGPTDEWLRIEDADRYGRGGLLPMAVFLTKNAPGLRTSPVKRGYWVVRHVLGEKIPPPPPTVPELPKDEAKVELPLPQLLARHRADKACAGCHKRFDAIGVVFEGFGPIGERRTNDLGGRRVEATAAFPDGQDRTGLPGLRSYLKEKRQDDFVDNLCKKLLSYALGRGLMLSDRKTLAAMKAKLAAADYRFGSLVEAIVMSPQFLNKRGRDHSQE